MTTQSFYLPHVCRCLWIVASIGTWMSCLALMHVGGNVVQAASRTVSKDIDNDPTAALEVRVEMGSGTLPSALTD